MTSTLLTEPAVSRPRPGPGPRVAPPAPDTFTPWATVLELPDASERFQWVMGSEGALMPVAMADDTTDRAPRRTALAVRMRTLLRR